MQRILVTGGAGFIGSHLVESLLSEGHFVTILDNMSSGNEIWMKSYIEHPRLKVIFGDIMDIFMVESAMKNQDEVWHLAGNANIPLGYLDTQVDLNSAVQGTKNILETMRKLGVTTIVFASSGAVYGNLSKDKVKESSAPLYPLSLYAAGKLAAEAFISAYCHLFGLRGYIFRFGNVVGERMPRGVIRDFIEKLRENPSELTILGDGTQEKSYFLVEECIEGMKYVKSHVVLESQSEIFNLGNSLTTNVIQIAEIIADILNIENFRYQCTKREAWPGDQPVVKLDVSKVKQLGWHTKYNSYESVEIAAKRMNEYLKK